MRRELAALKERIPPAGCVVHEREHLRAVLGDAAVADLAVAELAFQHPKHVLDLGAHLAEAAVPGTLALREVANK